MNAKKSSEAKFEEARKELTTALIELEEVTKSKLHESAMHGKILGSNSDEMRQAQTIIMEQNAIIESLRNEINNLQCNLVDLSNEVEFANEKNKNLASKSHQYEQEKTQIVKAIELELLNIENIINQEQE